MPDAVAVAIPTRNGARDLERTLAAVRRQTVAPAEVVVLDSSSSDGTADVARRFGAAVHVIPVAAFGHGSRAQPADGADARDARRVPHPGRRAGRATAGWRRCWRADAALAYGPYVARPGTAVPLRREYAELLRGAAGDVGLQREPCLRRAAWERVPFRDVPYAEDQQLALDLQAAGLAKAYVPEAAVLHSHDYAPVERLRRYFDEFRALHELYGWTAPASPRVMAGTVRAEVRKDRAFAPGAPLGPSLAFHGARVARRGARHARRRLPAAVRRRLSLEGRA